MKCLILFILCFSLAGIALAQYPVWSDPVALTDSLTNNTEATMKLLDFYAGNDFYVFWVKTEDSGYSDIMARRYYDEEEPVPVVYEGDYHYRNPQLIPIENWQYPDTLFVLFYEADIDGDFDIYYQKYTSNGFTAPVALTNNENDDLNMEAENSGGIVWESNGSIFFTYLNGTYNGEIYFDTVMIVDGVSCSRPSISKQPGGAYPGYLSWEKIVNDTSVIFLKEFDYGSWTWSDNTLISTNGANYHPKFSEGSDSATPPTLCWDNFTSDSSVLIAYSLQEDYFIPEFKQQALYNPHIFNVFIGVKWLWNYAILTFENQEQGQTDIYGGDGGYYSYLAEYANISNSDAVDRNPNLFGGPFGTYQDVINIWESFRNDHWQLYTAKISVPISGGTREFEDQSILNLKASPNPFHDETKLCFNLSSGGSYEVAIIDLKGQVVNVSEEFLRPGYNELTLKLSESLQDGLYYVIIRKGKTWKSIQLIKI